MRAQFENKGHELFPNQFVNVRLLVTTVRDAVLIPTSAIQHNGTDAFVYAVSGNAARVRRITPGAANGGLTAVDGLRAGEVVAISSFERLQDNARVTVASP
jgi:multidrug efflux system membrane fusion protein